MNISADTKPLIAITMGDPCGIGPEIIAKAYTCSDITKLCTPFVIGDLAPLERALKIIGSDINIVKISKASDARDIQNNNIALFAVTELSSEDIIFGKPNANSGDAVYRYIIKSGELALLEEIDAVVTAPINKSAMNAAGHDYPGHTELFAELCKTDNYVMMLAGDILRVSLVTIHEALADVPTLISIEKVFNTIKITESAAKRLSGRNNPKIAVLSLNPHCGENGMFGDEEQKYIEPAIKMAREEGIDAIGPLSADTLFYFAAKGGYDAVVAMYHDQGLIPLKMLHFDDGVNCTLGLPIIRTSVDHGTAYNLAGTGKASEKSLVAAVKMGIKLAKRG